MEEFLTKVKVMREMAFESTDLGAEKVLKEFYIFIEQNEDIIKECYKLDNELKKKESFLAIKRMLDTVDEINKYEMPETRTYTLLNERKFIMYKQSKGVIGVVYDGDVYITVELIAKAIKTGNALILNVGINNNIGTNNLLVTAIKEILEKNDKPKGLIDIIFSENNELEYGELDSLVLVGNKKIQEKYSKYNDDIIKSGYGYCEIYIDDLNNEQFIKEVIKKSEFKLKIYINKDLQTDIDGEKVNGCENAIECINKDGARFTSVIFSDNANCQKIFLKRCKSGHVFINADPNIAEDSNISIEDFYYNKIGMV